MRISRAGIATTFAGREKLLQDSLRLFIHRVTEGRHDNSLVRNVEVDVACRQTLSRGTGRLAVAQVKAVALLCGDGHRLGQRQLGTLILRPLASVAASSASRLALERILRVGLVIRPRENHLARSRESAYVVNVLVGFVVINAARQPDHLETPR